MPSNQANTEYAAMNSQYAAARDIDPAATTIDGGGLVGLSLIHIYIDLNRIFLEKREEYGLFFVFLYPK